MKKVMEVRKRKAKLYKTLRYAAAVFVTVLLVGGILFVGNEEVRASKMGINILAWMENFFLVDEGETSRKEEEVLFEESQIGYLPDGFEKVLESVLFSKVYFRYQNAVGNYIVLQVYRDKTAANIDNEDNAQEVDVNASGMEYRYLYNDESGENIFTWIDKENVYYILSGTLNVDDLKHFMNAISY